MCVVRKWSMFPLGDIGDGNGTDGLSGSVSSNGLDYSTYFDGSEDHLVTQERPTTDPGYAAPATLPLSQIGYTGVFKYGSKPHETVVDPEPDSLPTPTLIKNPVPTIQPLAREHESAQQGSGHTNTSVADGYNGELSNHGIITNTDMSTKECIDSNDLHVGGAENIQNTRAFNSTMMMTTQLLGATMGGMMGLQDGTGSGGGRANAGPYRGPENAELVNTIEACIVDLNNQNGGQRPICSFDDIACLDDAKRLLQEAVILPLILPQFFTGIREVRVSV